MSGTFVLFLQNGVKCVERLRGFWYNMNMGRIICLDVGDVRVGIAVSDTLHIIASPLLTYTRVGDFNTDVKAVADIVSEQKAELIVSGLPLRLDGNETIQTEKATEFANAVSKLSRVSVLFRDERLTTVEAEEILLQNKMRRDKRKKVIDQVAAVIILQSYLDSL